MQAEDAELEQVAKILKMRLVDLQDVRRDLFIEWLLGRMRYPTLSQQNQAWYARILTKAGRSNPTRQNLQDWFALPRGTAQYLSLVFFDPAAVEVAENLKALFERIRSVTEGGETCNEETHIYIHKSQATALQAELERLLGENLEPQCPPTLTSVGVGVYRLAFSPNVGWPAIQQLLKQNPAGEP